MTTCNCFTNCSSGMASPNIMRLKTVYMILGILLLMFQLFYIVTVYQQGLFTYSVKIKVKPDTIQTSVELYNNIYKPTSRPCRKSVTSLTQDITDLLWNRSMSANEFYNGNIHKHNPHKDSFLQVPNISVYLTSAIVRNRIDPSVALTIAVNGWEGHQHFVQGFSCCFIFRNGTILSRSARKNFFYRTRKKLNQVALGAMQYLCYIQGDFSCEDNQPVAIKITPKTKQCQVLTLTNIGNTNYTSHQQVINNQSTTLNQNSSVFNQSNNFNRNSSIFDQSKTLYQATSIFRYIPLVYPKWAGPNSIGICAKILYSEISAQRLIEWVEIYKRLGVDKIIVFYYNLCTSALNVLKYYSKTGFVELYPFDFPQPGNPYRYVGHKSPQPWNDEQVTVFECVERLQGHTFVGIFDTDEILLPRQNIKDLKQLMVNQLVHHPNATGFTFTSELFIREWANHTSHKQSHHDFFHGKYTRRTRPMINREKNIFLPSRIYPGSVSTHDFFPSDKKQRILVSSGLASIKHYRACPTTWQTTKCRLLKSYVDMSVVNVLQTLRSKIEIVTNAVFRNTTKH